MNKALSNASENLELDWKIGDVILDLYEVKPVNAEGELFHQGGFGKVYKVGHTTWNMDLAVKVPHCKTFDNQIHRDNFIKECQSWIELGIHPNIATCYYVRELYGVPHIFAEYVTGGSLKEWIESGRLYEGNSDVNILKRILNIAIQFAWGLHYAHEKGMIHQDVKPQNVMLTENMAVKVVDFGLARAKVVGGMLEPSVDTTQSILVTSAGGYTPAYCSPEQISGKKLTRRTDLWSWGVSLMEMFTGGVTWQSGVLAAKSLEVFLEHNGEDEDIPAIPVVVAKLLRQCFENDERNRPHNMMVVADQLVDIYRLECKEEYPWRWISGSADSVDTLNNYALSFLDLDELDKAKELWSQAIKRNSQHLESVYNQGLLLWRSGLITDLELLSQIENIKSNSWLSNYLLGLVSMERSDAESAFTYLEKASKHAGNRIEVIRALDLLILNQNNGIKCLRTFEAHSDSVNSVAFTKDQHHILSGSNDHTLRLCSISSGKCLRTFTGHTHTVSSVVVSSDGLYVFSGSYDHTLKLWELSTGKCLRTFEGHKSIISSVDISANGIYAISTGDDRTIRLWETSTGNCLQTLDVETDILHSIVISSDGRYALSGGYNKTLNLWDMDSGRCLRVFTGHNKGIVSIAISSDGRYILSGSHDQKLKLWEFSTGTCLRTFEGHTSGVSSVAFNLDSRYAISGSYDQTLRIWELASGKCLRTLENHLDDVYAIDISADGQFIISGSNDKTVKLWQFRSLDVLAEWCICKPESGSEVIEKESQFTAYLEQAQNLIKHGEYLKAVNLLMLAKKLPNCQALIEMRNAWSGLYRLLPKIGFENSWDLFNIEGHISYVSAVGISRDGRYMVSGSKDMRIKLWDITTGMCLQIFEGHKNRVNTVSISKDGRFVFSGSYDGTVRMWNVQTGLCKRTFKEVSNNVLSVDISADGRYVLSAGSGGSLKIWEVDSGDCLLSFEGIENELYAGAFSADGRYVISGGYDKTLMLWDIATGKCLRTFEGHTDIVNSIDLSADGKYVVSGSQDKTLKLWDLNTGVCLRTFSGHKNFVSSVALTGDGCYLISGSYDRTVKLWEIKTGQCLRTFEGHTDNINAVSISLDGRFVLSGGNDYTLRLWELDWGVELKEQAYWDEDAKPYIENFLMLHQPVSELNHRIHTGKPKWTEDAFNQLLMELGCRGYGWLNREGVKNILADMANQF